MNDEIRKEAARITALPLDELRKEFMRCFGGQKVYGEVFMRRRLIHELQVREFGGLTASECEMLAQIFRSDRKGTPKITYRPKNAVRGVTYTRIYKGKLISVKSAGYGNFEYDGKLYPSLTACVKAITGQHYSGRKFFNLGDTACGM